MFGFVVGILVIVGGLGFLGGMIGGILVGYVVYFFVNKVNVIKLFVLIY